MLKINIYVRFALIAICFILGIVLTFQNGFLYSIPFYLAGLFLLAGYFLLGTIASTSEMIQKGDFDAAEKNLKLTKKPEWLFIHNRGYYYLLEGTIAGQKKDIPGTEKAFKKALEIGLPSDNETAMIHLQLAGVAANKNNWRSAEKHIKEIKALNVTEEQINNQVKQFDRAIKQRGQMKHMRQPQVGGKKRRRY